MSSSFLSKLPPEERAEVQQRLLSIWKERELDGKEDTPTFTLSETQTTHQPPPPPHPSHPPPQKLKSLSRKPFKPPRQIERKENQIQLQQQQQTTYDAYTPQLQPPSVNRLIYGSNDSIISPSPQPNSSRFGQKSSKSTQTFIHTNRRASSPTQQRDDTMHDSSIYGVSRLDVPIPSRLPPRIPAAVVDQSYLPIISSQEEEEYSFTPDHQMSGKEQSRAINHIPSSLESPWSAQSNRTVPPSPAIAAANTTVESAPVAVVEAPVERTTQELLALLGPSNDEDAIMEQPPVGDVQIDPHPLRTESNEPQPMEIDQPEVTAPAAQEELSFPPLTPSEPSAEEFDLPLTHTPRIPTTPVVRSDAPPSRVDFTPAAPMPPMTPIQPMQPAFVPTMRTPAPPPLPPPQAVYQPRSRESWIAGIPVLGDTPIPTIEKQKPNWDELKSQTRDLDTKPLDDWMSGEYDDAPLMKKNQPGDTHQFDVASRAVRERFGSGGDESSSEEDSRGNRRGRGQGKGRGKKQYNKDQTPTRIPWRNASSDDGQANVDDRTGEQNPPHASSALSSTSQSSSFRKSLSAREAEHRAAIMREKEQKEQKTAAAPQTNVDYAVDSDDEDQPIGTPRVTSRTLPETPVNSWKNKQQMQEKSGGPSGAFNAPRAALQSAVPTAHTPMTPAPTAASNLISRSPATSAANAYILSSDMPLRYYPLGYFQHYGADGSNVKLPNYHRDIRPEIVKVGTQQLNSIFSSPLIYQDFFTNLICQDMQGRINKHCVAFAREMASFTSSRNVLDNSLSNPMVPRRLDLKNLQQFLRQRGIHFYDDRSIELKAFNVHQFQSRNQQYQKRAAEKELKQQQRKKEQARKRRKNRNGYENVEDDDEPAEFEYEEEAYDTSRVDSDGFVHYLVSLDSASKERSYREGDLWIISSDPQFNTGGSARSDSLVGRQRERKADSFFPPPTKHNFVGFVYAKWHGFASKRQHMEIGALPLPSANANTKLIRSFQSERNKIYAIRLPEFGHECVMLDRLNCGPTKKDTTSAVRSTPLLPYILHGVHWKQFQSSYDLRTGVWLSDSERSEQERRKAQSMRQTILLDRSQIQQPPLPTSFEPLSDPATHLLAALHVHEEVIRGVQTDIISNFALNEDQLRVLQSVADWFWTTRDTEEGDRANPPAACPIQLVHGCFGSGKSYLLVVIILFLVRVLEIVDKERKIKLMVAGNTNVAVDGILLGLQRVRNTNNTKFQVGIDFIRIGSIKKVAPAIIRHMLHVSSSGRSNEQDSLEKARTELKEMIRAIDKAQQIGSTMPGEEDAPIINTADRVHLERALQELEGQKRQMRNKRLESSRIVGLTVAACDFDIMSSGIEKANVHFPILLLDEASQLTEPAAMIPILQFKAERLLAVGDHLQLPPILEGTLLPPETKSSADALKSGVSAASGYGSPYLMRTLFVRLREAGIPTTLLRTQYRMHPMLSKIPNELFYENRLLDGVTGDDRYPLLVPRAGVPGKELSPFVFVDVPTGSEMAIGNRQFNDTFFGVSGGSLWNPNEIEVIETIVRHLLVHGIMPSQIGVITPYRAQMAKLTEVLSHLVATPVTVQPAAAMPEPARRKGAKQSGRNATASGPASAKADFAANILKRAPKSSSGNDEKTDVDQEPKQVTGAGIQVSTVDAFQGAEKDIIILSTVRTGDTKFLDNAERWNVSVTRARHHLILVGKKATLNQSPFIKPMISLSHMKPMAYAPNIKIFSGQIDRLRINPKLLEKPTEDIEAGEADQEAPPLALSLRNLARDMQNVPPSPSAKGRPGRRNTDASETKEPDDDFMDSDETPKAARSREGDDEDDDQDVPLQTRSKHKRRRSELDLSGLSPYSAAKEWEAAVDDTPTATGAASDATDDDMVDAAEAADGEAIPLNDLLKRQAAKAKERKQVHEANVRQPDSADDEEPELKFEPIQPPRQAPASSASTSDDLMDEEQEPEPEQAEEPEDEPSVEFDTPAGSHLSSSVPLDLDAEMESIEYENVSTSITPRREDVEVHRRRRKTSN